MASELGKPPADPASLPAPTEDEWRAMTPAERERRVLQIVDALQDPQRAMSEGRRHKRAKSQAVDALSLHFRAIGRVVYIAEEMPVLYPGRPGFIPDVLAVVGVEQPEDDPRMAWDVMAEGRGLDLVIEVLHMGNRKKDLVENVGLYASLGIPEYFVYDRLRLGLHGYRLPSPSAGRYQRLLPQYGRYTSQVLGLDLMIQGGRLRFFSGLAELIGSEDLIGRLQGMVTDLEAKADDAQAEVERMLDGLREDVDALLSARGIPCPDAARARMQECRDAAELRRWLRAAMTAATAEEIFGPG
jgi:Uma2 family endonuclease